MAETNSSNLLGNLGSVYATLGGPRAVVASSYFLLSLLFTVAGARSILSGGDTDSWSATIVTIFPSLAGFSIAAFALLFALLDTQTKELLSKPSARFGNKSPLLIVVSTLTHALIVQISSIVYAVTYSLKPFPDWMGIANFINSVASFVGLWCLGYGILLMLAVILTIFKMVELLTTRRPKQQG